MESSSLCHSYVSVVRAVAIWVIVGNECQRDSLLHVESGGQLDTPDRHSQLLVLVSISSIQAFNDSLM